MKTKKLPSFRLLGVRLPQKTSNENGRSGRDCGMLWQQFEKEKCAQRIRGKIGDEVYAVYFGYEDDHTEPFHYFIGCKVGGNTEAPEGMQFLEIPAQNYELHTAKGKMPGCIAEAWRKIWKSDVKRAYNFDFEVYDERSSDWENASVDIYLSVNFEKS